MFQRSIVRLMALASACSASGLAYAGDYFRHFDPDPVRPECIAPPSPDHTLHRAGHPECIARYAQPSNTPHYTGGYVGGGCAHGGEGRGPDDGSWGWDYCGWFVSHRPWLAWCHGRRCQGGTGAYNTDGPHVPDVLGHFGF